MHVLMISDVYFPRINGVSTSIQTFKQEFESQGHRVTLIAPEYPAPYPADKSIIRIPSRGVPLDPEDRMMRYRDIIARKSQLQDMGFDLVHIHTPFVAHYAGEALARFLGIPAIITYHTLFEEYLYHYIPFLPKQLLRACARRFSRSQCNQATAIVAPSSIIVDLLQGYGVQRSIQIIPTGIHCSRFENGDGIRFREKFGLTAERKLLLNVSRVAFEKNIGLLLEALQKIKSRIPEVCLVIAGEGPAKATYMEQASTLGLDDHILFVGYLDRSSELIDCYHSADLFVFSSKTETQGLVLLEAMATGTPLVSVAAMGTRDILLGCAGARIVEDDADDFGEALIDLLEDDTKRQQLAAAAMPSAREWDSTVMASKMLEFYRQVLDDAQTAAATAIANQQ
jgi:1,2-diacylglycerol 3-alpha-glucosyltransferase